MRLKSFVETKEITKEIDSKFHVASSLNLYDYSKILYGPENKKTKQSEVERRREKNHKEPVIGQSA